MLTALIVTIVVLLILAGISISILKGENGILVQTKSARIKTELSKFMEEGGFAYSELYAEKVNNPEVIILESDIIAKLMSNYGYEGRITEITDGVPTNITIGNITKDVVANGEKVVVGVQKGGGNSTYYVELLGKYYPIHFNNLEISVKEEEGQEQAGRIDNTIFTAVSDKEEVVIATAKNTNGVLTIELEGKSRGTADVTVTYGTLESKTIQVNVKGKTRIIVEAEIDSETGTAKGTITSPTELDKEYVDGEKITLTAEGVGSNKFIGWYIGETKLTLDANNQYTVPNNLTGDITIQAKFKGTEPTDIFVSFEESTGTLRFYNSEHTDNPDYVKGVFYKDGNVKRNFKNVKFFNNTSAPWNGSRSKINKVIFEEEIVPQFTNWWFYKLNNLTEIENMENLNTCKLTSMSNMFYECKSLTSIDLSTFDTSSVTDMSDMFAFCESLTNIDLSKFDTSKVINMSYLFYYCKALTSINLNTFDTSNATTMERMFSYCEELTSLEIDSFNTSSVTRMNGMFSGCKKLANVNVSKFDTSNVTNMSDMFGYCYVLEELDVSLFNTSNVTDMSGMFTRCENLTNIDVSHFNTSKVTNMWALFSQCYKLTEVNVSSFDTSKVTSFGGMFNCCSELTNIDVSHFDTSSATYMNGMFKGCKKLTNVDVSKFDTSLVTHMESMFNECSELTNLDVSKFNTVNVIDMSYMFYKCGKLTNIDVSNFNTLKVTNMEYMFSGCTKLTNLDVSTFDTSNVTSLQYMFEDCRMITILNLNGFKTAKVKAMRRMFYNCGRLEKIYVAGNFDTSSLSGYSPGGYMFYQCWKIEGGNGTKYNRDNFSSTYARIDSEESPGYFTDISQKPVEQ